MNILRLPPSTEYLWIPLVRPVHVSGATAPVLRWLLTVRLLLVTYCRAICRNASPNLSARDSKPRSSSEVPSRPRHREHPRTRMLFHYTTQAPRNVSLRQIGRCTVYDLAATESGFRGEYFPCVAARYNSVKPFQICTYSAEDFISGWLHKQGTWESWIVDLVPKALKTDPELGLLDVGANIGVYSLFAAAAMKRHVVLVEPVMSNLQRLHKSAYLNGVEALLTMVTNPVSDRRMPVNMKVNRGNYGASKVVYDVAAGTERREVKSILLDDVISLLPFRKARNPEPELCNKLQFLSKELYRLEVFSEELVI